MIPLTLRLKNFLSYGPELQTIDFGSHHLICLSGKNGHGKSALLDAITWAVWGQARKTTGVSKADAHLLRLGQTFMSVTFDFVCNGQKYRVKRDYGKTYAKPYAAVEFGILDDTNTFHALTDKTIRGTQKKIEQTIGIDFETFTNTAFLRQGQSHEFSQKSPKERKNVLANILGLQRFEILKKAALDTSKETLQKQHYLEQTRERLQKDIEQKTELEKHNKELTSELESLTKHETTLTKKEADITREREALQTKLNKLDALTLSIKHTQASEKDIRTELTALCDEWRTINQKRRILESHAETEQTIKKLRTAINNHQTRLQKQLELKEKIILDKEKLHALQTQREKEHAALLEKHQRTIHEHETSHKMALQQQQTILKEQAVCEKEITALTPDIKILTKKITALRTTHKEYEKIELQFEKRKRFFHEWTAQANRHAYELQQLKQKHGLVTDFENPSCPLCEQNLSASRKKFLKLQFDKQTTNLQHKINRFSTILQKLKTVLIDQHTDIKKLQKDKEELNKLELELEHKQKQLISLESRIKEITKQQKDIDQQLTLHAKNLEQAHSEHNKLRASLTSDSNNAPEYKEIHTRIETNERTLKNTIYSAEDHKRDAKKLQECEQRIEQISTIKQELTSQPKRYEQIQTKIRRIKELKKELHKLQTEADSFKDDKLALEKIAQQYKELESQRAALRSEQEVLLQKKGTLQAQQATITRYEKELKDISKQISTVSDTTYDYQILGQALGKDGIQALLIEEALPEIEEEANNLLSQLTDNQAHIMIESLRDLQKGGTKETLDIKISDPMGVRPYEMYSGGEAFRIDFALRIAISKLLAHRAGTSLQTLIIDEGFGSQDEEGLARIMDCIYRIQDNFHKVIIVSHLPVMKDQFPVHFCVEKGANGSKVIVVEQG